MYQICLLLQHGFLYLAFVVPTCLFYETTEETYKSLIQFFKDVDGWFQKTSFLFIPKSQYVDYYFYILILGFVYTVVVSLGIYVLYTFRFFKMVKTGSMKTQRMQIILFKAITVQIVLALVFLQIPALGVTLSYE